MIDLDSLFTNAERATERRALMERWRAEGLHDDTSLPDALERAAENDPDNTIVFHSKDNPGRVRLDALHRRSRLVATALATHGIRRGDVVAVQLPNRVETLLVYTALARLGAVFVPIVHIYGPKETDWILRASRARMFICPDRWAKIDFCERIGRMPACEGIDVVVVGQNAPSGTTSWDDLMALQDPSRLLPTISASDPLLIVYTSGTTAEPKGVLHTHQTLMAELRNMPHMPMGSSEEVSLQPWPAGHIGGLLALLSPIVTGFRCVVLDKWDVEDAVSLVEEHRVTRLCGAPFHVSAFLDRKEQGDPRLDSVKEVMSGGAGVPPLLVERSEAAGWLTMRSYGSTEHPTASAGSRYGTARARAFSDGAACPNSEIQITREDGTECEVGEPGEVWLRGPEQFVGYTDPELNRESFAPGGWFRTGDVGVMDREGNLSITDRIKDIIIRGGENLSSLEIEDLVLRHDDVAEAAAVGWPDPRYGERVCIFVVPLPGKSAPDVADLIVHFEGLGVARQKTPEKVVPVAELPRTAAGKIKKNELRRVLTESQASSTDRHEGGRGRSERYG
ncbi:MAG: cyclohexanecarboxylate-CoA ligase [Deltaproteobacteria bacterium]|nr:cyclohexanecarboxylate-CoA ligase [Deltaproteobacteria bacterium]